MANVAWDIRRDGRSWNADEAEFRSCHVIPDRPEIHHGKLYFNDDERLVVTACLLENLGLDLVVRSLANPGLWEEAIKAVKQDRSGEEPGSLKELADSAAESLANLDRELDDLFRKLERFEPGIAERAIARAGGRDLAALLLFCPTEEFGGMSALQLWARGKADRLRQLLSL